MINTASASQVLWLALASLVVLNLVTGAAVVSWYLAWDWLTARRGKSG